MIEEQSLLFSLGLAQKAGKTASGDFAVRSAIKNGKVKLLLLAADAAENSKKDLVYMCQDYHGKSGSRLRRNKWQDYE